MQNFQTLEIAQVCGAGFLIPPFVLHDATIFGPFSGYYWLVQEVTFFSSNSGSFPYALYLIEPAALQVLKPTNANFQATSAPGLGYAPSFYGTVAATAQPPLLGFHKIGAGSGNVNDGTWGTFSAQTQLSLTNTEVGGTIPTVLSKRKILVPAGWSLYAVAVGNSFGGCVNVLRFTYQQFQNGCSPDVWGMRRFRGSQLADINELTMPG